jgi:hypothetical protein
MARPKQTRRECRHRRGPFETRPRNGYQTVKFDLPLLWNPSVAMIW